MKSSPNKSVAVLLLSCLFTTTLILLQSSSIINSVSGGSEGNIGVEGGCDSCGKECTAVCGQRSFRACCFNYIKKKRGVGGGLTNLEDEDRYSNARIRFTDSGFEKKHSIDNHFRLHSEPSPIFYRGQLTEDGGDQPENFIEIHTGGQDELLGPLSRLIHYSSSDDTPRSYVGGSNYYPSSSSGSSSRLSPPIAAGGTKINL